MTKNQQMIHMLQSIIVNLATGNLEALNHDSNDTNDPLISDLVITLKGKPIVYPHDTTGPHLNVEGILKDIFTSPTQQ